MATASSFGSLSQTAKAEAAPGSGTVASCKLQVASGE